MSENINSLIEDSNNSCTQISLRYTRENIELRRARVLELSRQSESSISKTLGVSQALISLDLAYLRQQARNKIAEYLDHTSYEFEKTLTGLNLLIKKGWDYLNVPSFAAATTAKDKAVILSLIANIYNMKWQLVTNSDALDRAATYVVQKKKDLEEMIMIQQMKWEEGEDEDEEEEVKEEND
jgi:hypothetical protein